MRIAEGSIPPAGLVRNVIRAKKTKIRSSLYHQVIQFQVSP
jgi:hypothetical protein